MADPAWIEPEWRMPPGVRALTTLRAGGVSGGPFASLNLGLHVGDDRGAVLENRARLARAADLPGEPVWLKQVHGIHVCRATSATRGEPEADGAVTGERGVVCAVLTADCLPVFLARTDGSAVGVAHAGWRGLAAGVVEAVVRVLPGSDAPVSAWLGPAIGPAAFEVGPEVHDAFVNRHPEDAAGFRPGHGDRYLADLYALARARLSRAGVAAVGGGDCCTHDDDRLFFSHRRDGLTGRMASLIWLD
jgi:hypothetical protein